MKMYILVKKSVPLGYALVAVAHASLAAYLKFKDAEEVKEWLDVSFRKVICAVDDEEFERAKDNPEHVVITESTLNGQEIALAFKPRKEWPKSFQYFQLYRERY